uniref:Uncharacterized protein n=1 Tax=Glossina palpalis gambiensis TaxID=67801 RepID=A0A1B0AWA7_9MUSC
MYKKFYGSFISKSFPMLTGEYSFKDAERCSKCHRELELELEKYGFGKKPFQAGSTDILFTPSFIKAQYANSPGKKCIFLKCCRNNSIARSHGGHCQRLLQFKFPFHVLLCVAGLSKFAIASFFDASIDVIRSAWQYFL